MMESEPVHARGEHQTHTAGAPKESSPAQGSKYTCPMHPEIVRDALGNPVAAGVLYPAFGLLLSPIFAGAAMSAGS